MADTRQVFHVKTGYHMSYKSKIRHFYPALILHNYEISISRRFFKNSVKNNLYEEFMVKK